MKNVEKTQMTTNFLTPRGPMYVTLQCGWVEIGANQRMQYLYTISDDNKIYNGRAYIRNAHMHDIIPFNDETQSLTISVNDTVVYVKVPESNNEPVLTEPEECNHSWKTYHGFSESYEYCEHCDAKRSIL